MEEVMTTERVWRRGIVCPQFHHCGLLDAFQLHDFLLFLSHRIHTYLDSTKPIIDLYERMGKVRKVDASKSVDEVSSRERNLLIVYKVNKNIQQSWKTYCSLFCANSLPLLDSYNE